MSNLNHLQNDNTPRSLYTATLVVYILQAVALLTAIPMIIAVIINYVKLDETRNTWLASHFRWQLRTFWFGLLWYIIAVLTHLILIGFVIGGVTWIWQVYRVIRGWLCLIEHKKMYS